MPLILFYREDQSVADVAAALNLSENAVKKRLSRGRWMLREEIAGQVEVALSGTRPGARFTGIVVAGLAANAAAKPALAGAGAGAGLAAWKAAVAPGAAVGLGGAAGILAGLLGGWLGTWIPAQLAPTLRERETILHAGRRMLIGSVIFMAFLFGLIHAFAGKPGYLLAWGGWMVAFWGYVIAECVRLARAVKRIREQYGCSEPLNETAVRSAWATVAKRVRLSRLPEPGNASWLAPGRHQPERLRTRWGRSPRIDPRWADGALAARLDRNRRRRPRHRSGDGVPSVWIDRAGRSCLRRTERWGVGPGIGRLRRPWTRCTGCWRPWRRGICPGRRSGRLAGSGGSGRGLERRLWRRRPGQARSAGRGGARRRSCRWRPGACPPCQRRGGSGLLSR